MLHLNFPLSFFPDMSTEPNIAYNPANFSNAKVSYCNMKILQKDAETHLAALGSTV